MGAKKENPLNYCIRSRLTDEEGRKFEERIQRKGKTASQHVRELIVADLDEKNESKGI